MANEVKHTPGPWFVPPLRSRVSVSSVVLGQPHPYEVPIVYLADDPLTQDASEANARLIAAAPELKAALGAFIECAVHALCHFDEETNAVTNVMIDDARRLLGRIDGKD